ncbi:hypothetical protein [Chryseobacterium sp. CP-77]|uniref:hypothetical protein n=1 Tax=Chryseobacterium sp. CP-77 TaxID=3116594 RepID=UPI002ED41632
MRKKIIAEKKFKNANMKNYDLSKNMQQNIIENKERDKKIKQNLQELESETFEPGFDISILDVEIDIPELVVTKLDIEIPGIDMDFPEIEMPEMDIDIPSLVENADFELPDIDVFIEE